MNKIKLKPCPRNSKIEIVLAEIGKITINTCPVLL